MIHTKIRKKGFLAMWEDKPKPFELEWKPDGVYNLTFKGKVIADGRIPPDIITEMTRLMNYGYNEGIEDGIKKKEN